MRSTAACRSLVSMRSASVRRWGSTRSRRSSRPTVTTCVVADLILHGTRCSTRSSATSTLRTSWASAPRRWPGPPALDVLRQVRAPRPDVPIVCGGIHPTLFDRYILNTFPVQFVVRGEGEVAIARLCAALANGLDLSTRAESLLDRRRRTIGAESRRSETADRRARRRASSATGTACPTPRTSVWRSSHRADARTTVRSAARPIARRGGASRPTSWSRAWSTRSAISTRRRPAACTSSMTSSR